MATSLPHGVAVTFKQNEVYALSSEVTFVTSSIALETSLNGTVWTALANSLTGAVTGSVFIRCPTGNALVICKEATNKINVTGAVATLSLPEMKFKDLPTNPRRGTIANVSDSKVDNPGQTVVGGGSDSVLARWNGTQWIVIV